MYPLMDKKNNIVIADFNLKIILIILYMCILRWTKKIVVMDNIVITDFKFKNNIIITL